MILIINLSQDTEKQDEPVINIQETGNNEMSDDHSDIAENNDENRALIPGMYLLMYIH